MKDLLEKILSYLPVYIPDLIHIVSRPKHFVAERNKGNEGDLIKAFTFLGVSLAIFFILQAPVTTLGRSLLNDTASRGILYLLSIVVFSAVLLLSWRIVGGKATYQGYLLTSSYYGGVIAIGLAIATLSSVGILRAFYPESKALFDKFVATGNISLVYNAESTVLRGIVVSFLLFLVVAVPSFVWGLIGWGAYRELNQLPRSRSCAALFLSILFYLPIIALEMAIVLASS
jgi:hypothetical protein